MMWTRALPLAGLGLASRASSNIHPQHFGKAEACLSCWLVPGRGKELAGLSPPASGWLSHEDLTRRGRESTSHLRTF